MQAKSMHVLSVCRELPNPTDPAIGVFVARRLEAMSRLCNLEVVQPVNYFPFAKPLPNWAAAPRLFEDSLSIHPEPMFYIPRFLKALDGRWLQRSLTRAIARRVSRPTLIDAHFGYPEGVGAVNVATAYGIPSFVTIRGFEAEYIHKPVIGPAMSSALRRATGCICVSYFLRDVALAAGVPEQNIAVVHNGIDRATFYPGRREASRKQLKLPPDIPILVSVGHLTVRKRHHVLVEAFAELRKTIGHARLLIIGNTTIDTSYTDRVNRLIALYGLEDSVSLVGNVGAASIPTYLRAANAFALATQREGCCNAVLEALACGLPVVTTPVGDNSYFVKDGINGALVAVDDAAAMGRALAEILQRKDWEANCISEQLGVGDWTNVAKTVIEFMNSRLACSENAA